MYQWFVPFYDCQILYGCYTSLAATSPCAAVQRHHRTTSTYVSRPWSLSRPTCYLLLLCVTRLHCDVIAVNGVGYCFTRRLPLNYVLLLRAFLLRDARALSLNGLSKKSHCQSCGVTRFENCAVTAISIRLLAERDCCNILLRHRFHQISQCCSIYYQYMLYKIQFRVRTSHVFVTVCCYTLHSRAVIQYC